MSDKSLNLLGLMRKANAIAIGETNTGCACRDGKAKLLILASDASDNARMRSDNFVRGRKTVVITVPFSKEQISDATGVQGCSMAAITDLGFANAFVKGLSQQYVGQYEAEAAKLSGKLKKAARRKKTDKAADKKTVHGNREE